MLRSFQPLVSDMMLDDERYISLYEVVNPYTTYKKLKKNKREKVTQCMLSKRFSTFGRAVVEEYSHGVGTVVRRPGSSEEVEYLSA
jgi:hypothetical protein